MSINIRWKTADGKFIKINALEDGGFESNSWSYWTRTGTDGTIVVSPVYAGSYALSAEVLGGGNYGDIEVHQAVSVDSDLVSEVYCYVRNFPDGNMRITYDDASFDEVVLNDVSGNWVKKSITPDANKVITDVRVYTDTSGGLYNCGVDNVTITCQNRVSFAVADGKLTQDTDFPTTITKNVFINVGTSLYQANQETY